MPFASGHSASPGGKDYVGVGAEIVKGMTTVSTELRPLVTVYVAAPALVLEDVAAALVWNDVVDEEGKRAVG